MDSIEISEAKSKCVFLKREPMSSPYSLLPFIFIIFVGRKKLEYCLINNKFKFYSVLGGIMNLSGCFHTSS